MTAGNVAVCDFYLIRDVYMRNESSTARTVSMFIVAKPWDLSHKKRYESVDRPEIAGVIARIADRSRLLYQLRNENGPVEKARRPPAIAPSVTESGVGPSLHKRVLNEDHNLRVNVQVI
jgi:hypothetical protein